MKMAAQSVRKLLACFHAFCEECLKQSDQKEVCSGELKCPECSKVTDLQGEGVAGLKWNPLVCRLVELLEAKEKASQVKCDACGDSESPLTTYCRDCFGFICDSCASYHGKMKLLLKDHNTVPLDKIINGTINIKWMEEGLWKKAHECEEHSGELRRFYCRTCKKRICRDCIVLEHTKPDHDYTTVQKMFQEAQEKVKYPLKRCKEKEEHVSTMLNDVYVRETGANQKFHMMKESIRDLKSTADANLNRAEEELLQKVEVLEEKLNDKLQAFRDNMKITKENLTKTQSKAKEVASAKEVTDISRGPFLPEDVLTPCPLNPSARITVDSQSCIVVADYNHSTTTDPGPASFVFQTCPPSAAMAPVPASFGFPATAPFSTTSGQTSAATHCFKLAQASATPVPASFGFRPAQIPKRSSPPGFSFGEKLPQQPKVTSTASAGTFKFGSGNTENKPSSAASNGKEGKPESGLPIPTTSTTIYRGKPGTISSHGMQSSGVLGLGSSQLSSDSFKVPLDRVRSIAAAKSGQLVFLRWDKKAVIITDKDGRIQHKIKEPGRMYLSISCTESGALFVLSASWGSHIVTLTKHSLEDGALLEYIIDDLDVSANFKSDEWPVIGNHGNDTVVINIGDEIRVYSAEEWG